MTTHRNANPDCIFACTTNNIAANHCDIKYIHIDNRGITIVS